MGRELGDVVIPVSSSIMDRCRKTLGGRLKKTVKSESPGFHGGGGMSRCEEMMRQDCRLRMWETEAAWQGTEEKGE
jgi:hypothetical protein